MAIGAIRNIGGGGKEKRVYKFSTYNNTSDNRLKIEYYENDKLISTETINVSSWELIMWSSQYFYAIPSVKIDPNHATWYVFTNGNVVVNGVNYNKDTRLTSGTTLIMGYNGHYTAEVEFQ